MQIFPGTVTPAACSASSTSHATKASWVFCFCFCGLSVSGGAAFGMRKRQQGGQQRHGIGLREAIVAQRVLEFLQLGCRRILARKLQQPLQVVDDRIQGTVLVIGRAAKLDARRPLVRKLLFELLHQAGFANPRLAAQQHHLAGARFGLLPALAATIPVLLRGRPAASSPFCTATSKRLCASLSPLHAIQRQRSRDVLQVCGPRS